MQCIERVAAHGGYQFHQCTREAVEDGLCRMHLAAKRRREANAERKSAERRVARDLREAQGAVIESARDLAHFVDGEDGVPESFLNAVRSTVRQLEAAERAARLS